MKECNEKGFKYKIYIFLMALCTTVALKYSVVMNIQSYANLYKNESFVWTMFFVLSALFYYNYGVKVEEIKRNKISSLVSFLFSAIMTAGNIARNNVYLSLGDYDLAQKLIILIEFIGLFYLFFILLKGLNKYTDKIINIKRENCCDKRLIRLFDNHTFLASFIVIFLLWLPWIVVSYPGSISFDSWVQLYQGFGYIELTNQHPIFTTYLIKAFLVGGRKLGFSDNNAILFYTLFQAVILNSAISYSIAYMKKLNISIRFRVISVLFFGLYALWGIYSQWIVKDIIHCSMVLFFIVFLIRLINSDLNKVINLLLLLFFAFLVVITRNNGIYIVIPTMFFGIFLVSRNVKKKLIASILCLLALIMVYNKVVVKDIEKTSKKEMLSVMCQQTASYLLSYGDEITDEEYRNINRVFEYEQIKNNYNSDLADTVKETYKLRNMNSKEENAALKKYFKTWFIQFLKHPGCYFRTTFANTYNYYYPENKHVPGTSHVHMESEDISAFVTTSGDFNIYKPDKLQNARNSLWKLYLWEINMPIIGLFDYAGTYTWIYMLLIMQLIRYRKKKYIIALTPVILVILICIASPVNGTTRYMLPAMIAMPLMISYTINICRKGLNED